MNEFEDTLEGIKDQALAAQFLFSTELFKQLGQYIPSNPVQSVRAKLLSGRMLEEVVELHLESGGSPASAMMHTADAITNESFKNKKALENLGVDSASQLSYPSRMTNKYNRAEVVPELADAFFLLATNMIVNKVTPHELLENLKIKLEKLDVARQENRLTVTNEGLFYIRKNHV